MKRIFTFIIVLFTGLYGFSQNCTRPVSGIVFQQRYNQLVQIRQDQQRLARALEFVENNCLLAYQVKQIAELFDDELSRLSFAEKAYLTTIDKDNFYDVYDAFGYFSTVMRLHDYIAGINEPGRHVIRHEVVPEQDYRFPDYNYPSYRDYHESTRCSEPVSDEVFHRLLKTIMMQRDDELRMATAIKLAENNCLTVEQIMKIGSMIQQESRRLDYLKKSYDYSYDMGNYRFSGQLLSNREYSDDFNKFMATNEGRRYEVRTAYPGPARTVPCGVSDQEFSEILGSINSQPFNNTQLTLAKQIVKSKECFTVAQIKQILDVFSFESSKLDMAKYSYQYCIDKSNYYKINDSFKFSSSVDELDKFIREQQ